MPRMSLAQKCSRFLYFLMGVSDPAIARHLDAFGFDQAALDEGWRLLREAASSRWAGRSQQMPGVADLQRLDQWENLWFPIINEVLRQHHPAVHEEVFHKLAQTEGAEVVVSVGILLQRLEALRGQGAQGRDALASLARYGLSDAVLAQARGLLQQATALAGDDPDAGDAAAKQRSEQAMWRYYRVWSTIARSAIKDRRLLRRLGFQRARPGRGSEDALEPDTDAGAQEPG